MRLAVITLLFFTAQVVHAQSVQDPQLAALLEAGNGAEAQKLATAKITAKPDDMDAYTALALAATSGNESSASLATTTKRREDALQALEACAERLPKAAPCLWGAGAVAGVLAMQGGMLKGMSMAPKIKANFIKALEADALYTPARSGLIQYYLAAPAIAGGSVTKAMEAATAEQARQPEHAKLFKEIGRAHV